MDTGRFITGKLYDFAEKYHIELPRLRTYMLNTFIYQEERPEFEKAINNLEKIPREFDRESFIRFQCLHVTYLTILINSLERREAYLHNSHDPGSEWPFNPGSMLKDALGILNLIPVTQRIFSTQKHGENLLDDIELFTDANDLLTLFPDNYHNSFMVSTTREELSEIQESFQKFALMTASPDMMDNLIQKGAPFYWVLAATLLAGFENIKNRFSDHFTLAAMAHIDDLIDRLKDYVSTEPFERGFETEKN